MIAKKSKIHIVKVSPIREGRHVFSARVIMSTIGRCCFLLRITLWTKLFDSEELKTIKLICGFNVNKRSCHIAMFFFIQKKK